MVDDYDQKQKYMVVQDERLNNVQIGVEVRRGEQTGYSVIL